MELNPLSKYFNSIFFKKYIPGIAIGGVLGYAYYYFFGCTTGACTITSDPLNTVIYGGIMGLIWVWPQKSEKKS
ncbi:MAG: DUF6132 family protein [Candidatus Neomarinimicrobiota bacterium]